MKNRKESSQEWEESVQVESLDTALGGRTGHHGAAADLRVDRRYRKERPTCTQTHQVDYTCSDYACRYAPRYSMHLQINMHTN